MAKYSSKDLSITFGGTNITQHVRRINNVDIEALLEESHSFGDTWFEMLDSGIRKMSSLEVGGLYDDAAGGPNAVLNSVGTSGEVVITWGGSKTTTVTMLIQKFSRIANLNGILQYSARLDASGAAVEA